MKSMKLTVLWPQGTTLPVRIHRGATAAELLELLKFSVASGYEMFLTYKGFLLNPNKTLESQLIRDGSTLNVEFVPEGTVLEEEVSPCHFQKNLQEIYAEALRLSDLKYSIIDSNPNGGLTYQELLKMDQQSETSEEEELTIISESECIQTEPLPSFWISPNKNFDENGPQGKDFIETVDSASSALIAKQDNNDWAW